MKSALLALLLAVAPLAAQSKTEHLEAPFNTFLEPACGAEAVNISGTVHGTITVVENKNGYQIHSEWGPRNDVEAIGMETGNTYRATGHTNSKYSSFQNGVTTMGYADEFNIVGLYRVHYDYEVKFIEGVTKSGEWYMLFKSMADNFKAVCAP